MSLLLIYFLATVPAHAACPDLDAALKAFPVLGEEWIEDAALAERSACHVTRCFHRKDGVRALLSQSSGANRKQLEARKRKEEAAGNYDAPLCLGVTGNVAKPPSNAAGAKLKFTGAPHLSIVERDSFPAADPRKQAGQYPKSPRFQLYTITFAGKSDKLQLDVMGKPLHLVPFLKATKWGQLKALAK